MFYLGRHYDTAADAPAAQPLLYESRDLTTHAAIIGMTGSGKTGLGIGLLEEAAIDGIPVIAIDPKGDLGNLLLTFPELAPEDFEPWVNPRTASDQGLTTAAFAAQQAQLWRNGLGSWGQDGDRIRRLREAATTRVFTPGSDAGEPLSVLGELAPPPGGAAADPELLRERVEAAASSLLALLGIDADPLASREHLLIANILQQAWAAGQTLTLAELIHQVQQPPFERLGVMTLDSFYPEKDRFALAMRLNALLASPGFDVWMRGEPLSAQRLFYTSEGRPQLSVVYIAHLNDAQRMFVVCQLLAQIIAWMRAQPGTGTLRAVLYMDEVFGFLPPVANPPAKPLFLTLLKQARAYGLGLVLATQNPVDLDYRALSNTGSWMIGRLQTERDKARVAEGLGQSGAGLERRQLLGTLSALGKRQFLLHNVHEDEPVVFETRWVMSYLAGPLTREQIRRLRPAGAGDGDVVAGEAAVKPDESAASTVSASAVRARGRERGAAAGEPWQALAPLAPAGVPQFFAPPAASGDGQHARRYVPVLLGVADVGYHSVRYSVDVERRIALTTAIGTGADAVDWAGGDRSPVRLEALDETAPAGAEFAPIPSAATASALRSWERDFKRWVRTQQPLVLYRCPAPKVVSSPEESLAEFRARVELLAREARDLAVSAVRTRFAKRLQTLEGRRLRAGQALQRESEQARGSALDAAVTVGSSVLGMLMGRKRGSRLSTVSRRLSSTVRQRSDVERAKQTLAAVEQQYAELEEQARQAVLDVEADHDPAALVIEELPLRAKSTDISVRCCALLWQPLPGGAGDAHVG